MFFIEDKSFLNNKDIDYINKNIIYNNNFPMFLQHNAVAGDNNYFFCHTVIHRYEQRGEEEPEHNSFLGPFFSDLLKNFCKKHKIKYDKILRCAINTTFKNKLTHSNIHTDHLIPHKQLIIYLNDVEDKDSKTVILDKNKKTKLKVIQPELFKIICFEDRPHYMYFPKYGIRMIAILTFN
jgi:hypothetical protein|tara:strand:- start:468 stop:1007 length:540 start_codon:yes stop_codon:yes gene_type:complete